MRHHLSLPSLFETSSTGYTGRHDISKEKQKNHAWCIIRKGEKNSPEKALRIVNEELFNNGEKNIPLKAFLGILSLRSGMLLTINSGHVNPIIKTKNGNTSFIIGPFNSLLGASSNTTFTPLPLPLNAGDDIYFYSNDIIEMSNTKGEKYNRERLLNIISSAGNKAQDIIKSIIQDVTDFKGEKSLEADIAIAVLEYTPETAER